MAGVAETGVATGVAGVTGEATLVGATVCESAGAFVGAVLGAGFATGGTGGFACGVSGL